MTKNKVIILMILIVFFLCSCTQNPKTGEKNRQLDIFYYSIDRSTNIHNAEYYTEWNSKFNQTFEDSMNFTPIIISSQEQSEGYKIDGINNKHPKGGIVVMPMSIYMENFDKLEEYFVPLDDYINNLDLDKYWPESLLEYGINPKDGKIWCFPVYQSIFLNLRVFNQVKLDEMGVFKPKTLEEFVALLSEFKATYNKPGIALPSIYGNPFDPVSDLFGLIGIKEPKTIVYDFNSQKYINVLDNPKLLSLLESLKEMHDNGLIYMSDDVSHNQQLKDISNGDILTMLMGGPTDYYDSLLTFGEITRENNSVNSINELTQYVALMLKNTDDYMFEFSEFGKKFLYPTSEYLAASLGFSGEHYNVIDGKIKSEMSKFENQPGIFLSSHLTQVLIRDTKSEAFLNYNDMFMSQYTRLLPAYVEYIKYAQLPVYDDYNLESINMIFSRTFMKMFTEGKEIDDLIDEYEVLCLENDVNTIIYEANQKLNDYKGY